MSKKSYLATKIGSTGSFKRCINRFYLTFEYRLMINLMLGLLTCSDQVELIAGPQFTLGIPRETRSS